MPCTNGTSDQGQAGYQHGRYKLKRGDEEVRHPSRHAVSNLSAKVESTTTSITNYCEDGQDQALVEKMVSRVREICTSGEEILYLAMQSKPIANFSPDCVVLSNKRFIIYRVKMLGRVTFYDCLWKDSKNVHMKENILGAEISFESKSGRKETIDYLPKSQARKTYSPGWPNSNRFSTTD